MKIVNLRVHGDVAGRNEVVCDSVQLGQVLRPLDTVWLGWKDRIVLKAAALSVFPVVDLRHHDLVGVSTTDAAGS